MPVMPPAPGMVMQRQRRLAGDVLAHVARREHGVEVVGAADPGADQDADVLALVEFARCLRPRRVGHNHGGENAPQPSLLACISSHFSPLEWLRCRPWRAVANVPGGRNVPMRRVCNRSGPPFVAQRPRSAHFREFIHHCGRLHGIVSVNKK